ncbi:MAG: diaminopimelate epimerase [Gammaproteobacteria bacterium]|nr:diaminopimelate epimerase [Gammaproteobacteria bacterium]
MIVRFTKMHGAGNDFIVIDAMRPDDLFDIDALGAAGRAGLADRHTGIGCDQLLVLKPPRHDEANVWIRIFNADGDEAAQCGNGMRCIARYLADQQPGKTHWRLDGVAGLREARIEADGSVSIEMGRPDWGADATGCKSMPRAEISGNAVDISLISMGNPHAVLFVDAVDDAPVDELGPELQQFFYNGVNVGFAQIIDDSCLALRVWERGVGETRACGTGACAAVIAAVERGLKPGWVSVDLPGGQLMVKWAGPEESVWLRGPAQRVFEGQTEI